MATDVCRLRSLFLVVTLLLLPARFALAQTPPELLPVPEPDLSSMEEGVRERLESMHAALLAATSAKIDVAQLGEAYGTMGQHYLAHELLDPAEACFRNAGRLQPGDYRWPYYLGIVLQTRGEPEEAAAQYGRVLELAPNDLTTLIRLGNVELDLDDAEAAAGLFRRALSLSPDSAAAHYGLGRAAAVSDDAATAVEEFEKTLELQPEASIVHYPLGQAYRKLGDLDKAREHLMQRGRDEVVFPDPLGNQVAWLTTGSAFEVVQDLAYEDEQSFSERDFLGFVLSQLGDVEGAVEQLEEALRIKAEELEAHQSEMTPEEIRRERLASARMHYAVGGLLVKRRSDLEARRHFEQALELAPEMEDPGIKLGNILARAGDFEAALHKYTEVLDEHPGSTSTLLKRAAVLMHLGDHRRAIDDLERVLSLDTRSTEARFRLAQSYEELDEPARARAELLAALELDLTVAQQAKAQLELGKLDLAEGGVDSALERFQTAVGLDPELVEAHFQLGTTLGRRQRYEESARAYGALLELDPRHVQGRLGEATALLLLGHEAEALECLEAGLAHLPESLELSHAVARLLASAQDRSLRDGDRATELAMAVVRSAPTLDHAETLAMALAEAGRFDDAVSLQRDLLRQAEERGDRGAAARLGLHLSLYEAKRSCCEVTAPRP